MQAAPASRPDTPAKDYVSCARVARRLIDGESAGRAALDELGHGGEARLQAFARQHHLREWLLPLQGSDRLRAASAERTEALRALTFDVRALFERAGVESLTLKGVCLAARFYPALDRRFQFDVDVLVPRAQLMQAAGALEAEGFERRQSGRHRLSTRLWQRLRAKRPHALTLYRAGRELDLHASPKADRFPEVDTQGMWTRQIEMEVEGHRLPTLSNEDTLRFVTLSVCADLRRGACRAKHMLDLEMILRALGDDLDVGHFLDEGTPTSLRTAVATTLAIYLALWEGHARFPRLAQALTQRAERVCLIDDAEPLRLATRERGSLENLAWFAEVHPPRSVADRRRLRRRCGAQLQARRQAAREQVAQEKVRSGS